jgi:hypothetical protein
MFKVELSRCEEGQEGSAMARRRKNRDAAFKARVALEAVKERKTVGE